MKNVKRTTLCTLDSILCSRGECQTISDPVEEFNTLNE